MSDVCLCAQEHVTDPWTGRLVTQTRVIVPDPTDDVVVRPNFLHALPCWAYSHLIARQAMCGEVTPDRKRVTGHRGVHDNHLRTYHPECVRL